MRPAYGSCTHLGFGRQPLLNPHVFTPMQDIELSCNTAAPHPFVARMFHDMLDRHRELRQLLQRKQGHGHGSLAPAIELKPVPSTEVPPVIFKLLKEWVGKVEIGRCMLVVEWEDGSVDTEVRKE